MHLSGLEVVGFGANSFYELPDDLTQEKMPVSTGNVVTEGHLAKWPYLSKVGIPHIMANVNLLTRSNTH